MKGLENKVVLVTGASGGIGSAVALRLARMGAKVAIHYNSNEAAARELASRDVFQSAGTGIFQADLTREEAVADLWEAVEKELGGVNTLVCNAGYLNEEAVPLRDMGLAQWQTTQDRNMLPYFLCMREFFRGLERHPFKRPSAVMVTSMSGVWGQPFHCDYAAAKAAATYGMLPSLKDEIVSIAPRGRVNAVAPGFVLTGMVANKMKDETAMKKVLQTASLRKFALPQDVAATVCFLANPDLSGHITGEVIRLAGGKEGRVLFDVEDIDLNYQGDLTK